MYSNMNLVPLWVGVLERGAEYTHSDPMLVVEGD